MPETTFEEIVEEVKALPPPEKEQLREALNALGEMLLIGMVAQLLEKTLTLMPDERRQLTNLLNRASLDMMNQETKADFARSIKGKYAHLHTSSEAFAVRKAEEIELEDRRSRP